MGITTAERQQYQLKGIEAWLVKLGNHEKPHHSVEDELYKNELSEIKAVLKQHKSHLSFLSKHVKPPVTPPRHYFNTGIVVSGKRTPFTKYASHKGQKKALDTVYETDQLWQARVQEDKAQKAASAVQIRASPPVAYSAPNSVAFPAEIVHIKVILSRRRSSVLANGVLPPVAPPRRYKLGPIVVAGKRVPFTLKFARQCRPPRRPLGAIDEGLTQRQKRQRTALALARQACNPEFAL
ncbi:hypothetical protein ACHHYP_04919 [Achlya hypogyna]|uniref:Uncharacterized protein n=1 Tax=Achlya hypogyna TaxID=1202772 RepID=A0A1V9YZF4_ACHHY|nr:hypothetical protein ACHHYP_04919 [Achlya hypogyna]